MPTGTAIRDVREQLFAAAERVLLRAGPSGLTSRAVTTEAGVAKGVLHKHFADFDDFLAAFVSSRVERVDDRATALREAAGTGDVIENLTDALVAVFGSVALALVPLVTFRGGLRTRLRASWPAGVPVLTDAAEMVEAYLEAEQRRGRIAPEAEAGWLGPMLIGTTHLMYADRDNTPPDADAIRRAVTRSVGPFVR